MPVSPARLIRLELAQRPSLATFCPAPKPNASAVPCAVHFSHLGGTDPLDKAVHFLAEVIGLLAELARSAEGLLGGEPGFRGALAHRADG